MGWETGFFDMKTIKNREKWQALVGTKSYLDKLLKEYGPNALVTAIIESELQK
tara:strand:- start:52 stop:210 length:159 start_codon:yes stop_codon:yes gene_type:complete